MSNILDTRDLQERLEELQGLKEAVETAQSAVDELMVSDLAAAQPDFDEKLDEARTELDEACEAFDGEAQAELEELESIAEEVSEWHNGNQLIPEEDFEDYCQELCEDIGDIPKELPSYIVIDWEATARNLKADYSEVEYQGTTYLYRDC
jgi:antirestriction protein